MICFKNFPKSIITCVLWLSTESISLRPPLVMGHLLKRFLALLVGCRYGFVDVNYLDELHAGFSGVFPLCFALDAGVF